MPAAQRAAVFLGAYLAVMTVSDALLPSGFAPARLMVQPG
jgi:hypothetical protein